MPMMINPLRYPGAKRSLSNYIDALLQANHLQGCTFFEPYAGSAAVGLELLQRNQINTLVLCEKDIPIYAFWECVFRDTDRLCEKIERVNVSITTWHELQPYREMTVLGDAELLELAYAGLFFNRTNFSGILKANPIGGIRQQSKYAIDCRFNKGKIIEIIRKLAAYRDHVEVYCNDALFFMRAQDQRFLNENCFAFFDPPYYEKGAQIYRYYYTNQDHVQLANYVRRVHHLNWLISYDDAPYICGLYGDTGTRYQPMFMDYSCASRVRTTGQELLISNLPLPPFAIGEAENL